MLAILLALLILGCCLFVLIQTQTLYFEYHYPTAVACLFLISAIALSNIIVSVTLPRENLSWLCIVMGVLGATLGIPLFVAKLIFRDNWNQIPRRLLRTPTTPDFPYEKISVRTSDGVDIKGYYVHTLPDEKLRRSVVVIAHGGFRSKDLFVKVLLTAWLCDQFDVIGFDFRGHGESGGNWTGDGKTVADLKAIVDFAKQKGYQKIGLFGRSMGGWTAILEASDYHNLDAIVVAGLPPGYFSQVPEFQGRIAILKFPGAAFLMRIVMGVRFDHFADDRAPIKEINRVSPIPLLIIYNETDPSAGVIGRPGHWDTVSSKARPSSLRRIKEFPFTAQQVYDAASDPKELFILPGAGHVYTLRGLRSLFDQVERWFKKYLD